MDEYGKLARYEHFVKDLVSDKMFYQKMFTQLLLNKIHDYTRMRTASYTLYEVCHFCDMSLKEERVIRDYGWKEWTQYSRNTNNHNEHVNSWMMSVNPNVCLGNTNVHYSWEMNRYDILYV